MSKLGSKTVTISEVTYTEIRNIFPKIDPPHYKKDPIYRKKIFGKFMGKYYVCKNK
jgi:hypothetical protein